MNESLNTPTHKEMEMVVSPFPRARTDRICVRVCVCAHFVRVQIREYKPNYKVLLNCIPIINFTIPLAVDLIQNIVIKCSSLSSSHTFTLTPCIPFTCHSCSLRFSLCVYVCRAASTWSVWLVCRIHWPSVHTMVCAWSTLHFETTMTMSTKPKTLLYIAE